MYAQSYIYEPHCGYYQDVRNTFLSTKTSSIGDFRSIEEKVGKDYVLLCHRAVCRAEGGMKLKRYSMLISQVCLNVRHTATVNFRTVPCRVCQQEQNIIRRWGTPDLVDSRHQLS